METRKYTKAEWARIQARLPKEDREPYSSSPMVSTEGDPLVALQKGVTESKAQVKAKNIEISTIALEKAINTGNTTAAASAASKLADAQGLTGAEKTTLINQSRQDAQATVEANRELSKPTTDPGQGYIWSYSVSEGRWKRVFTGAGFGGGPTGPTGPTGGGGGGGGGGAGGVGKTVIGTYTDPVTGDVYLVYSDSSTTLQAKGTKLSDAAAATAKAATDKAAADKAAAAKAAEEKLKGRQSAFDLLLKEFDKYGLRSLVEDLRGLIEKDVPPEEFTLALRSSKAYENRFFANKARVQRGLRALDEGTYIGLEDQYQDIMRRYGLPETYYTRGEMGRQEGFEKFISGDVSPIELEDRIQIAQRRILNAPKQVKDALTQFYGSEISNGDILAYALDPDKAIENIKRKVTVAEIGAGALTAGLTTGVSRAEELQRYGVTGGQALEGYQAIAGYLPRASTLANIYEKQGMGPFTQATAEAEAFGISGATESAKKRRKLEELEQLSFSGQSGIAGSKALSRSFAGQY